MFSRRPGARFNRGRVSVFSVGSSYASQPIQTALSCWLRDTIVKTGGGAPANGDACEQWTDQSGNARNFTAPGADPTYVASAQGGRHGLRFTKASSQYLQSGANLSSFISNATGTIQVIGKFHAYATNSNNGDANEALLSEAGGYMAMNGRSADSGTYQSYNYDTGYDRAETIIGDTDFHLFTWQHASGAIYASVDGSSLVSTPAGGTSGNTGGMGVVQLGKNQAIFADITICEVLTYTSALSAGDLATNWSYVQGRYGLT